jgi:hypothetical protein
MDEKMKRSRRGVLAALGVMFVGLLSMFAGMLLAVAPAHAAAGPITPPANYPVPAGCRVQQNWKGFAIMEHNRPALFWYRVLFCTPPSRLDFQTWRPTG